MPWKCAYVKFRLGVCGPHTHLIALAPFRSRGCFEGEPMKNRKLALLAFALPVGVLTAAAPAAADQAHRHRVAVGADTDLAVAVHP